MKLCAVKNADAITYKCVESNFVLCVDKHEYAIIPGEGETIDSIIKEYDLFVTRYVYHKKCWFTKDYNCLSPIYYEKMYNYSYNITVKRESLHNHTKRITVSDLSKNKIFEYVAHEMCMTLLRYTSDSPSCIQLEYADMYGIEQIFVIPPEINVDDFVHMFCQRYFANLLYYPPCDILIN